LSTVVTVPGETFPTENEALFARGDGLVAAYVAKSGFNSTELRARPLDATGAPAGPEVLLAAQIPTYSAKSLGGVVRPDGSFGVVFNMLDDVVWFSFDANGAGDPAGVVTLSEKTGGAGLAAHASGRFFVVWRETLSQVVNGTVVDTCALFGQVYSPDLQKLGKVVPVYTPVEQGHCAYVPRLAANAAGDVIVGWRMFVDGASVTEETSFFVKIFPGLLGGP
jgi:hypothetical protein